MIARRTEAGWQGVEPIQYKDRTGTFRDVVRHVLFDSENSAFQVRCFQLEPGGYTSFERHAHEHFVSVLRGSGRVRLGDEWTELSEGDVVGVESGTPHQFVAHPEQGLWILCVVDRERDRPVLLQPEGNKPDSGAYN